MIIWKSKNERRRELRANRRLRALIRVLDAASQQPVTAFQEALVINISKKGLCLGLGSLYMDGLHLTHCLQSPEEYLIGLNIIPPDGDPWPVTAELKWINRQMDEDQFSFRVGVVFQQALPEDWQHRLGG